MIEVYLSALGVRKEALLNGPLDRVLAQQWSLRAATIFAQDGVMQFIKGPENQ